MVRCYQRQKVSAFVIMSLVSVSVSSNHRDFVIELHLSLVAPKGEYGRGFGV